MKASHLHPSSRRPLRLSLVASLLLAPLLSGAVNPPYEETEPDSGMLGIFYQPTMKLPGSQLVYARSLKERGKRNRAIKALRNLVMKWPESTEAAPAQRLRAELLAEKGRIKSALEQYQFLLDEYAGHFPYEEILGTQFALAEKLEKKKYYRILFGGISRPLDAVPYYEHIAQVAPQWQHAPEAQYRVGKIYASKKKYEEAIPAYDLAASRYAKTPWGQKAAFGKAYCLYRIARDTPNDDTSAERAWAALTFYLSAHPGAEDVEEALRLQKEMHERLAKSYYDKAHFYDRIAQKPKAALIAYRALVEQFPLSKWTPRAKERIQVLQPITTEQP